jgi:hypothetical protein
MKKKVLKKKSPAKKPAVKKTIKKAPSKKVAKKKVAETITHTIRTSYLGGIFGGDYAKHVDAAVETVKKFKAKNNFDAIAFMGTSGAGMAFPLSYFLKLPLIHIPKPGVSRHSNNTIEGTVSSKKYLIVDDFLASGNTVRNIERVITDQTTDSKPVGIFLYESRATPPYTLGKYTVPVITMPTPAGYYPASYTT